MASHDAASFDDGGGGGGGGGGTTSEDDDDLADALEAELVDAEERRQNGGGGIVKRRREANSDPVGCSDDEKEARRVRKAARVSDVVVDEEEEREQQTRSPACVGRQVHARDGMHAFGLASLPQELMTQILRWLSPEDLTTLAVTCRQLRVPTQDESLWRRCYCARFGHPNVTREEHARRGAVASLGGATSSRVGTGRGPGPSSGGLGGGSSWRALYFQDDARELRQAVAGAPSDLRPIYAQMQAAKRSHPPDPVSLHGDEVLLTLTDSESVSKWRATRGLGDGTDPAWRRHTCSLGHGCTFHRIGADIFVCEATGRAHVCDDACRERVVDMDGMSETCAISGRSFDRIWVDEHAEGLVGGYGGDGACVGGDPTGERGWLRGCYEAGYGASSEKEMYAALWGGDGSAAVKADGGDSDSDSDSDSGSDPELMVI